MKHCRNCRDTEIVMSKPKMQGVKDWIKGEKLETVNLSFLFCNKWTQMKRENYSRSTRMQDGPERGLFSVLWIRKKK